MNIEKKAINYLPLSTPLIGSLIYFGNSTTTAPIAISLALLAYFWFSHRLMRDVLRDSESGVEMLYVLLAFPVVVSLLSVSFAIHALDASIAEGPERQFYSAAMFASILSHVGLFAFIVAGAQEFAASERFRALVKKPMVWLVCALFALSTFALISLGVFLSD